MLRRIKIQGQSPVARRADGPIQLKYGRCSKQQHQHPACGGLRTQEDATILRRRHFMPRLSSVRLTLDLPEADSSGGFCFEGHQGLGRL